MLDSAGIDAPVLVGHSMAGGELTTLGNQKKRDYSSIRVPVLALFEFPRSADAPLRADDPQPRNEEERATLTAVAIATKAYMDRWVDNLKRSVPDARLVDLPGAGHYVFITREADVLRELKAFVENLAQKKNPRAQ